MTAPARHPAPAVPWATRRLELDVNCPFRAAAGRREPGATHGCASPLRGLPGLPGRSCRDGLTGQEYTPRRASSRLEFPLAQGFAYRPVALPERAA